LCKFEVSISDQCLAFGYIQATNGERVMKTLEDSQSEDVRIDVLREMNLHREETNEIPGLAFEDISPMRILSAGRKRTESSR
jgi:hypothetical protein